MQEPENTQLSPHNLSFESLKKQNVHGVEYWSARDFQPCLGYSKWQRFEPAIKKAIESCKRSGNDPQNHFTGAGKMVGIGSQTEPENIPSAESIKKVEKRVKSAPPRLALDPKDAVGIANHWETEQ